jgi:hypothetical protein
MGSSENTREVLGNTYPDLGASAKQYLIRTFELAHEDTVAEEISEERLSYLMSVANMAFAILAPYDEIEINAEHTD